MDMLRRNTSSKKQHHHHEAAQEAAPRISEMYKRGSPGSDVTTASSGSASTSPSLSNTKSFFPKGLRKRTPKRSVFKRLNASKVPQRDAVSAPPVTGSAAVVRAFGGENGTKSAPSAIPRNKCLAPNAATTSMSRTPGELKTNAAAPSGKPQAKTNAVTSVQRIGRPRDRSNGGMRRSTSFDNCVLERAKKKENGTSGNCRPSGEGQHVVALKNGNNQRADSDDEGVSRRSRSHKRDKIFPRRSDLDFSVMADGVKKLPVEDLFSSDGSWDDVLLSSERASASDVAYDARVRFNLGELNLSNDDLEKARENFGKSLRARIELNGPFHETVAVAHEKLGDVEELRWKFDHVHEHYNAAMNIIKAVGALKSSDAGRKIAEEVDLELQSSIGKNTDGQLTNKRRLRRGGKNAENDSELDRKSKSKCHRDLVRIMLKKAHAYAKVKEKHNAKQWFEEAIDTLVSSPEGADGHAVEITSIQIKLGYLALDIGDDDTVLKVFSEATKSENRAATTDQDVASMYYVMGLICERRGHYDDAMEHFAGAISLKKAALGVHPDVGTLLRHMGFVQFNRDKYDDALECYNEALSIMRQTVFNHEDASTVSENIVLIHRKRGEMDKIVDVYLSLLEGTTAELGDKNEHVAAILHKLAHSYIEAGQCQLAVKAFKREGKIRNNLGDDSKSLVKIMIDIGAIQRVRGDMRAALMHYDEAVNILAMSRGVQDDSSGLEDEDDYSMEAIDPGDEEKPTLDEKFKTCEDVLQHQDFIGFVLAPQDFADMANDMGNIYLTMSSNKEAISCYRSAIRIQCSEDVYDEEEFLKTKYNLGLALYRFGSSEEAISVFNDVVQGQEKLLDDNSVELANTLNQLGNVHLTRGSNKDAVSCYKRALKIKKERLDRDDEARLGTLTNLGVAFFKMGSYNKALHQFEYVLRVHRASENHVESASVLSLIGHVHAKNHDYAQSLDVHKQCLRLRQNLYKDDDPIIGRTMTHMAVVHLARHEFQKTKGFLQDALAIFKKAGLPSDHPYMKDVKKRIMQLDKALERAQGTHQPRGMKTITSWLSFGSHM